MEASRDGECLDQSPASTFNMNQSAGVAEERSWLHSGAAYISNEPDSLSRVRRNAGPIAGCTRRSNVSPARGWALPVGDFRILEEAITRGIVAHGRSRGTGPILIGALACGCERRARCSRRVPLITTAARGLGCCAAGAASRAPRFRRCRTAAR
jgi:hypothetical protein